MFPREQHINTNNLDSTDEQAGTRTEHKQKERDNKTTAEALMIHVPIVVS
jgi:hypothetical protein